MKKFMKQVKKHYKLIITVLVILIIAVFGIFIYKNIFQEGVSERLEGIENYKVTKKEINLVKEKINELEGVSSIDISTNYKIIKIFIELEKNVDFDKVKQISNDATKKFSEENLSFYDVEIFIDCLDEEIETYPKIGYKYKTNSEFTWNR